MKIQIVTAPYDSGVRDVGKGLGPARLLDAGLADRLGASGHGVEVSDVAAPTARVASELSTAFGGFRVLAQTVRDTVRQGRTPLLLTGSCYYSVGMVAGLAPRRVGVVWLDTHTDINTPDTTQSGFLDGMAAAMLTGRCFRGLLGQIQGFRAIEDDHLVFVGVRDLDQAERALVNDSRISVVPPGNTSAALGATLDTLRERVDAVYVHLDLDVLDPKEARANELAAPDGLSPDELAAALREIRDRLQVAALTCSAYDPMYDPEGRVCQATFSALEAVWGEAR